MLRRRIYEVLRGCTPYLHEIPALIAAIAAIVAFALWAVIVKLAGVD